MTKDEIRTLALLAAAKVTLVFGGAGCGDEAVRPPRTPYASPPTGASCASPASGVAVPAQTQPLNAGGAGSAAPAPTGTTTSTPDLGACEALLLRADRERTGLDPASYQAAWACCEQPGLDGHAFCNPWGPPAPPAMDERAA